MVPGPARPPPGNARILVPMADFEAYMEFKEECRVVMPNKTVTYEDFIVYQKLCQQSIGGSEEAPNGNIPAAGQPMLDPRISGAFGAEFQAPPSNAEPGGRVLGKRSQRTGENERGGGSHKDAASGAEADEEEDSSDAEATTRGVPKVLCMKGAKLSAKEKTVKAKLKVP